MTLTFTYATFLVAHFLVQCGDQSYVGTDTYHFSPLRYNASNIFYEPWICYGMSEELRPRWKLLGYFTPGKCDFLKSAFLNPQLCSSTQYPTTSPTASPTYVKGAPTPAPTSSPTLAPTFSPTCSPTLSPTSQPSSNPTPQPTSRPTGPSYSPTRKPTSPTALPTSNPTQAPTTPRVFTMPCYFKTGRIAANCSVPGAAAPRLIVDGAFSVSSVTPNWGMLTLVVPIKKTRRSSADYSFSGCRSIGSWFCQFWFTNARTGERLFVSGGVPHWALFLDWIYYLYFIPGTASQGVAGPPGALANFSRIFAVGDEIIPTCV